MFFQNGQTFTATQMSFYYIDHSCKMNFEKINKIFFNSWRDGRGRLERDLLRVDSDLSVRLHLVQV